MLFKWVTVKHRKLWTLEIFLECYCVAREMQSDCARWLNRKLQHQSLLWLVVSSCGFITRLIGGITWFCGKWSTLVKIYGNHQTIIIVKNNKNKVVFSYNNRSESVVQMEKGNCSALCTSKHIFKDKFTDKKMIVESCRLKLNNFDYIE